MNDRSAFSPGWQPATYYPDPAIHALDPWFEKDDAEFVRCIPKTQKRRSRINPAPALSRYSKIYAALKPAIALTSRNSSKPYWPHSRPLPDCL
jgi:hypothetical protein